MYTTRTSWLFNHRVVTLVADKLDRQWLPDRPGASYFVWYGHCVCVSVNKVGGGHAPQEIFFKFVTLRWLMRPCLAQKTY